MISWVPKCAFKKLNLCRYVTGGEATATALAEGLAEASAALLKHAAEVQLGNAELTAMLAAAVGAVKSISGVETLQSREAKLLADLEEIAILGGIKGLVVGGGDGAGDGIGGGGEGGEAGAAAGGGEDGGGGGAVASPLPSPTKTAMPSSMSSSSNAADFTGVLSPPPSTTPELAAATRKAVDLCRAIHEAAAARALRLDAEASHSPMSEALKVLRGAGETLEKAKIDVAALSEDSRTQLIEAERFRDTKSAELKAAETAVEAGLSLFTHVISQSQNTVIFI